MKWIAASFFMILLIACSSKTEVIEKYSDGSPKKTIENLSDHTTTVRNFYPNGQLQEQQFFKDQLQDSIQYNFSEQGFKIGEMSFRSGKRNGQTREFYLNGQVAFEGICVNGNFEGLSTWFYPNGKIQTTGYRHLRWDTGRWNDYDTLGLIKRFVQYHQAPDSAVYYNSQGVPVSHEAWEQLR
jgi:antitoxin component YwqK of YwqJK toxin-antitoxin module